MKIAGWSGPRNMSTAMMYSFAARGDCTVLDEPFYAAFLEKTGLDHPMREVVIEVGETDPHAVRRACLDDPSGSETHVYQKHMAHHMLEGMPLDWLGEVANLFLIRHPARVVASYAAKRERPVADDLGAARLREIYEAVLALGQRPAIVDTTDLRANPAGLLEALCDHVGLPWTEKMLAWPPGGHADDGPWATHWYGAAHRSTGFAGPEGDLPELSGDLAGLAASMMADYEALAEMRLRA